MTIPPPAPDSCTKVGPEPCTVGGTILGYYPDIGVNASYTGFFAVCALIHLALGARYRTWSYMVRYLLKQHVT